MGMASTFQRLYATYTAWQHYTSQKRQERHELALENKARCFRGASLLATHYYRWVEHIQHIARLKRQAALRLRVVLHSCFATWISYNEYVKVQVERIRCIVLIDSPRRRVLREWRQLVLNRTIHLPTKHREDSLMRKAFNYMKTTKALRLVESIVLPICTNNALKSR